MKLRDKFDCLKSIANWIEGNVNDTITNMLFLLVEASNVGPVDGVNAGLLCEATLAPSCTSPTTRSTHRHSLTINATPEASLK